MARLLHALLILFLALLLALPLPSPPFFGSNALPSYAIILLAISMMEEDGMVIWLGYVATIASAIYLTIMIGLHLEILLRLIRTSTHWWNS